MSIIDWPLDKWLDNVALAGLCSKETLLTTFELAQRIICQGIPGDFVELGVAGGSQCAVMARALMIHGVEHWDRRVHLFDSFTGIPAAGLHDGYWPHPEGTSACSREAVQQHMVEWGIPLEYLMWHEGLFSDTVPAAMEPVRYFPFGIALLRLDGDLYQSTKDSLPLWQRLNTGGWLIVDDYNLPGCRKALDEAKLHLQPAYFQKQP